jgi:23S rRNA (adenine2030-N6)-methyltransferase
MLSYRHAFHAGNFADVLKHNTLTLILNYMTRKEKGFTYIDSHSGAGMYQLNEDYAQKTGEYKNGIEKLLNNSNIPEALVDYIEIINKINTIETGRAQLTLYPGSPGIARHILRRQDSAHLFELHPSDYELLTEFTQHWRKSFVKKSDGYQGILALVPPPSRRAVVLIDPPYELKDDYSKAVQTIISGYQKFATGTYILWYPVVKRQLIEKMAQQFTESNLKNLLQVEFCVHADNDEYGMTGSGLFIVNPPWQLAKQMEEVLPYLVTTLGNKDSFFTLEQLISE